MSRKITTTPMTRAPERMGEQEKSVACMKQIYEVDYGYKDVAKRVESSYARDVPEA